MRNFECARELEISLAFARWAALARHLKQLAQPYGRNLSCGNDC